jgi:hypothetical protein
MFLHLNWCREVNKFAFKIPNLWGVGVFSLRISIYWLCSTNSDDYLLISKHCFHKIQNNYLNMCVGVLTQQQYIFFNKKKSNCGIYDRVKQNMFNLITLLILDNNQKLFFTLYWKIGKCFDQHWTSPLF